MCQTALYSDPGAHELGIYLHAMKYACADGRWEYETTLPEWALPPPGLEGPKEATKETDPIAVAETLGKFGLDVPNGTVESKSNKCVDASQPPMTVAG